MKKVKPFKVPVKSIDKVLLCTKELTPSKGKSHKVQYLQEGKTVSGTTWAHWANKGTDLKVSGQANGFITHLRMRTDDNPKRSLVARDYNGTGTYAAWAAKQPGYMSFVQAVSSPGYVSLVDPRNLVGFIKSHANGLVKLGGDKWMPIFAVPNWSYDTFPAARRKNLEKKYTPKSLVDDVVASKPKIVSFKFEPAMDKSLKGYSRANIVIEVGSDFFDHLYNGPAGIRGQHFLDPVFADAGQRMRHYFIQQWLHQLAEYMDTLPGWQTHKGRLKATQVAWSILNDRAKIWQVEAEPDLGHGEQLNVKRWASFENTKPGDPVCDFLELDASMVQSWAMLGMDAPLKKQILIMGNWINDKFKFAPVSALPKRKRKRDKQVSYLGFS
jgi:hypothetical protein